MIDTPKVVSEELLRAYQDGIRRYHDEIEHQAQLALKAMMELAEVKRDRDECAKLLAEIIDTQPVALVGRDWSKVKRVIRRSFPDYDPYVQPWPACLTGNKEDGR